MHITNSKSVWDVNVNVYGEQKVTYVLSDQRLIFEWNVDGICIASDDEMCKVWRAR